MSEYFVALHLMHRDKKLPLRWWKPMLEHTYQVVVMASNWHWHTCHHWSETVCMMIMVGRLPSDWNDPYAIKDLQRDICALGTCLEKTKTGKPNAGNPTAAEGRASADHHRPEYNQKTGGKPCLAWNWGSDCSFVTSTETPG